MSQSEDRAIVTPFVDLLCGGAVSIVMLVPFCMFRWFSDKPPTEPVVHQQLWEVFILTAIFNWPHFMGSYLILYGTPGKARRHPWASIVLPGCLVGLAIVGFFTAGDYPVSQAESQGQISGIFSEVYAGMNDGSGESLYQPVFNPYIFAAMYMVSVVYLAWHYTGQSWGMTASFAAISGIRMDLIERRLIRLGYRVLLVFHVSWWAWHAPFLTNEMREKSLFGWSGFLSLHDVYNLIAFGCLLTIPAGVYGFYRIRRRAGVWPPLRSIVPWVATYVWYFSMYLYPETIVIVQLLHALQYLSFPLRVEVNRYAKRHRQLTEEPQEYTENTALDSNSGKQHTDLPPMIEWKHLYGAVIYVSLVAAGGVVFFLPGFFGLPEIGAMIASIINIHHYFADGCIWKISSREVRADLFAHLKPN